MKSSKYKWVHWNKTHSRWQSRMTLNGKRITIGTFIDEKEAAIAYNEAQKKHLGNEARLVHV